MSATHGGPYTPQDPRGLLAACHRAARAVGFRHLEDDLASAAALAVLEGAFPATRRGLRWAVLAELGAWFHSAGRCHALRPEPEPLSDEDGATDPTEAVMMAAELGRTWPRLSPGERDAVVACAEGGGYGERGSRAASTRQANNLQRARWKLTGVA